MPSYYMAGVFAERNANRSSPSTFTRRVCRPARFSLAAGCSVVCAFVNDTVDRPVIEELAEMGVGLVALSFAGWCKQTIDLDAAIEVRCLGDDAGSAYSPQAVGRARRWPLCWH